LQLSQQVKKYPTRVALAEGEERGGGAYKYLTCTALSYSPKLLDCLTGVYYIEMQSAVSYLLNSNINKLISWS
jgi:hypothetical protein